MQRAAIFFNFTLQNRLFDDKMVEKFIMAGDTALHVCDSEGTKPDSAAAKKKNGSKGVNKDNATAAADNAAAAADNASAAADNGTQAKEMPCLVLLHGYLESMLVWEEFVPLLYGHARVVTLDLPGHGISEVKGEVHTMDFLADTVAAMLDKLGIERCTVVGHSMGGYVSLALCERHPEKLDGIVLLSSTPNADSDEKREARKRETELVKAGKKDLLARTASSAGFAKENRRAMQAHIDDLEQIAHLTEDAGITALLAGMMQRRDMNDMLRKSKVRQLFILGCRDEYIPEDAALRMIESHPQARVVRLERSGHQGFMEQPEECAAAIIDFLPA